ncbi:MAG: hypothetical protein M1502_03235 [Deltaproteobacteria bacterium]|uniref:Ribbon-helix-helix domain-containing protein n=1 Tax=Candidatus Acidulodesulfobacterium acidiphilum TaxID=2597224 RepID=A0A520XGE0_9DELT|nr:hypothetical protein [Deltaproteobacteria bacterium]RZV40249.1 MAG: hypothetical protein EVJ48_01785 [Candidatus Acidulodesulfobacterium acidiphilum]
MSIFERLVKEETVSLKNVKISKSIYDLITEVSKKYKVEQSEIVKTLIESSKQKLIEDLNGKNKAAKSKKTEEK